MLVSINGYNLCDGTRSGGVALSELGFNVNRTFDVVDPLQQVSPIPLDRTTHILDITFTVRRVLNSLADAEKFILNLEDSIPSAGTILITAGWISPVPVTIPNGALLSHQLVAHQGATVFHQYRIVGGAPT
jgi:hypothetical protein